MYLAVTPISAWIVLKDKLAKKTDVTPIELYADKFIAISVFAPVVSSSSSAGIVALRIVVPDSSPTGISNSSSSTDPSRIRRFR